jgi:Protein of unknown function (DUF1573)
MTRSLARGGAVASLALIAALLATTAAAGDEKRATAPRIRVEPEGFDFGRAQQNKTLRKEFTLRNFGEAQLVIEGVSTTCGCTAAITADTHVEPGGSTQLRVTLQTRSYSGKVERQVLVRSNDPETPLLSVMVSATVEKAGDR